MELDKKQLGVLLFYWIKSDQQLRLRLRDIQIKILIEHLVKGMTFKELSEKYKTKPKMMRLIFHAMIRRIKKEISKPIAKIIKQLSDELEHGRKPSLKHEFNIKTIHLN